MKKIHESEGEYRFGTSGPKYLLRGPHKGMGIVAFHPGEDFPAHYHQFMEESFLILEGEIDIYLDGHLVEAKVGDLVTAELGEVHYLVNRGDKMAKAVFMLSPWREGDKVVVDKPIEAIKDEEKL